MSKSWLFLAAIWATWGVAAPIAQAQVFSSEFFSDPVSEGWVLSQRYCDPTTWNANGWYYQQLNFDACEPGPFGGHESYRRSLVSFNGAPDFFAEYRVMTDGNRSEMPYGAPVVCVLGNFYGVAYHVTISSDLAMFYRDSDIPIWFVEIDPATPRTYRVELHADSYAFYVDGYVIDEGLPEGPFPAFEAEIAWQGDTRYLPCDNAWDYIRYGVTPADGSSDFDSDAVITLSDFYFVQECLTNERIGINGGPGNDAGPGCRFADSDVDLLDFAEFQNIFTGQ